jgi:flagellar motor component MotA
MIIIIGAIVVTVCVIGGFIMGGGHVGALIHPNELIIIGGGALGALIIMSPKKVLIDMVKGVLLCLKGAPHNLKGPVVFNRRTLVGKQVVLANAAAYSIQHPLSVGETVG